MESRRKKEDKEEEIEVGFFGSTLSAKYVTEWQLSKCTVIPRLMTFHSIRGRP